MSTRKVCRTSKVHFTDSPRAENCEAHTHTHSHSIILSLMSRSELEYEQRKGMLQELSEK